MSLDTLPEKVRHSALAQTLADKLSLPQPVDFDYWGEFKKLRDQVSAHVGEIKVLFPWFTPHDEENHLSRLFGIADKLLGPGYYARMNAAELFLLACGLYAHDWGMAVGSEEIAFLRSGGKGATNSDVFTPLDDEQVRLHEFVEKQGLRSANTDVFPEMDDDYLRAYVRHTHAWRSGVRAREFFKVAGASLPQALERVCQGHWLDFSELDDEHRFSAKFGVLGQTVNLRAIALYVRLVDLFDIADDRTPYAIWRFVAPRDPKSRMEWSKHRALSPVTFPQYGDGRAVRFDGSTTDPEVWAELEDLRNYCEDQLAGSNDLLARHRDERHQLDLRKIDWAIIAERFTPVNIRFQFHRQRMFEILADEIYQGDSHVFLRELLQNSIDAIRMRRELVLRNAASSGTRRDVGLGFDDAIYFNVEHGADGAAVVRCCDNGIGMDEYVIRNYLSVAGVSYYQSDEFRHLGLKMDPISRFGIGILSCFMVAERIEIETNRLPHLAADSKPLRIDIPAVECQFRVYPTSTSANVGTCVTVHVCGKKLRTDVLSNGEKNTALPSPRLQVTEYLAAVAGFVEFPIVVDEDGQRTVILHPSRPVTDGQDFARNGETVNVRQLSSDYPWDEVFVPQDAADAAKVLRQRSLDLRLDLGLEDYEGYVSYLTLSDEKSRHYRGLSSGLDSVLEIESNIAGQKETVTLRLPRSYLGYQGSNKSGIAPSSRKSPELCLFRDGLLLAEAMVPNREYRFHSFAAPPLPLPVLKINLSKRTSAVLDIARRTLKGSVDSWDAPIWDGVVNYLRDREFKEALQLAPPERFSQLAMLANVYWICPEEIKQLVSRKLWPVPKLTSDGRAVISDECVELGQSVFLMPWELKKVVFGHFGWGYWDENADWSELFAHWKGGEAITLDHPSGLKNEIEQLWMTFTSQRYSQELAPVGISFVSAPFVGFAPLPLAEFICVNPIQIEASSILKSAVTDIVRLDAIQRCALKNPFVWSYKYKVLADAAPFAAPFADYFAWGKSFLNLNHLTVQSLIRCAASLQLHRLNKGLSSVELGKLEDALTDVIENLGNPVTLRSKLDYLWSLVKSNKIIELEVPPSPTIDDYVWGSLDDSRIRIVGPNNKSWHVFEKHLRPFGLALTDPKSEELPVDLETELRRTD